MDLLDPHFIYAQMTLYSCPSCIRYCFALLHGEWHTCFVLLHPEGTFTFPSSRYSRTSNQLTFVASNTRVPKILNDACMPKIPQEIWNGGPKILEYLERAGGAIIIGGADSPYVTNSYYRPACLIFIRKETYIVMSRACTSLSAHAMNRSGCCGCLHTDCRHALFC